MYIEDQRMIKEIINLIAITTIDLITHMFISRVCYYHTRVIIVNISSSFYIISVNEYSVYK